MQKVCREKTKRLTPRLTKLRNFKPKSKTCTSNDDDSALDQKIILCFGIHPHSHLEAVNTVCLGFSYVQSVSHSSMSVMVLSMVFGEDYGFWWRRRRIFGKDYGFFGEDYGFLYLCQCLLCILMSEARVLACTEHVQTY